MCARVWLTRGRGRLLPVAIACRTGISFALVISSHPSVRTQSSLALLLARRQAVENEKGEKFVSPALHRFGYLDYWVYKY
jgi:hypothetical protein